jgi:hypothetical protein
VTVEDAGKYKVTAKNELGESNATISLNFDSKYRINNVEFSQKLHRLHGYNDFRDL